MPPRLRADRLLVERGLFESRAKAQAAIAAGLVTADEAPVRKPSDEIAVDAAVQAARTRLRPILMTSFAFVLGVVPLAIATGAGAEMRQALGTAVFFGMLGVTLFGLLFTPVFYVLVRAMASRRDRAAVPGK